MANKIYSQYPMFFNEDGSPIEGGHVYIGVYGLNPISNPLTCYYDEAMTIPAAAKDIRISGGYIVYKGAPRNLYVPGDYSISVYDKNGSIVWSKLDNTASDASLLLTLPRGTLSRAMRTPNSYNFNNILESGYYSWTDASTTNFPSGCAAADLYGLSVMAAPDGSGIIYQRLVDFTTGPTSSLYTWERQSVDAGTTWSSWYLLSSTDSISERTSGAGVTIDGILIKDSSIKFPAVQVPSSNVNTLDDYEEGTWAPTIIGSTTPGTQTYSAQYGQYIKIGKYVHAQAVVAITAKDAAMAGNTRIGGLPFPSASGTGYYSSANIGRYSGITFAAGQTQLTGRLINNVSYITLWGEGSAAASSEITVANTSATSDFTIDISYIAEN